MENLKPNSLIFGYNIDTFKIEVFTIVSIKETTATYNVTVAYKNNNDYMIYFEKGNPIGNLIIKGTMYNVFLTPNALVENIVPALDDKIKELTKIRDEVFHIINK